jgi:hypothetical protein
MLSDLIVNSIGEASLTTAHGRGSRRVLSLSDSVILFIAQDLRDVGFAPGDLKTVSSFLRGHWSDIFPEILDLDNSGKLCQSWLVLLPGAPTDTGAVLMQIVFDEVIDQWIRTSPRYGPLILIDIGWAVGTLMVRLDILE